MSTSFATPQDAEDAFYDAIDDQDLTAMTAVWEGSEDIACLLPMTPLLRGAAVREAWASLLSGRHAVEVRVEHLHWIEMGDLALHYVAERVSPTGQGQPKPATPMYATNLYRRGTEGWRMILHQNSPTPPPPGAGSPDRDRPPPVLNPGSPVR
jgi:ketosteroid isomerase-like protein